MTVQRSILIFADCFPPSAAVGIHRTVGLCRHLCEQGWRVRVVTARPGADDPADQRLLDELPASMEVRPLGWTNLLRLALRIFRRSRRKAPDRPAQTASGPSEGRAGEPAKRSPARMAMDWLSCWLQVPDSRIGWIIPAVAAGLWHSLRARPAVVYGSAPSWSSHLAAALTAALLGRPFVADFRDPWCGSAWRNMPYAVHRHFDEALERFVVGRARRITCAWDGIARHLRQAYPDRAGDISTILNGFDPRQMEQAAPLRTCNGCCVLLHAGTFYGHRSPLPLLEGLRELRRRRPEKIQSLRVLLVGLPHYDGRGLDELIRGHELAEIVEVLGPRPYAQSLSLLKGADVALLFGQSGSRELASIPAKVYEYIGAGKPVLAVGTGQEAAGVLKAGGCRLWRAESPEELAAAAEQIVDEFRAGRPGWQADPAARQRFTRRQMAADIQAVLEETIASERALECL